MIISRAIRLWLSVFMASSTAISGFFICYASRAFGYCYGWAWDCRMWNESTAGRAFGEMLSAILDALPKVWRTWTSAVTQQGSLSLYRIHLLPLILIVFNIFCLDSFCGWWEAPPNGHCRYLVGSPCDYSGISHSRCSSFRWLPLGERSINTEDAIHVVLCNFVRTWIGHYVL